MCLGVGFFGNYLFSLGWIKPSSNTNKICAVVANAGVYKMRLLNLGIYDQVTSQCHLCWASWLSQPSNLGSHFVENLFSTLRHFVWAFAITNFL